MQESTSREKVLKKIRKALIQKSENPYPGLDLESNVFEQTDEPLEVVFAEEFNKINGKFIFCENINELGKSLKELIADNKWDTIYCLEDTIKEILQDIDVPFSGPETGKTDFDACISSCECLVARTGTILTSSAKQSGRRMPAFTPVHIVITSSSQLVHDLSDGIRAIQRKYKGELPSMISAITGPSRTADIEKTLIIGAHGPKEVYVFMIDSGGK